MTRSSEAIVYPGMSFKVDMSMAKGSLSRLRIQEQRPHGRQKYQGLIRDSSGAAAHAIELDCYLDLSQDHEVMAELGLDICYEA